MAAQLLLAYAFTTLVIGAVCIGAVLMLAWLRQDELARAELIPEWIPSDSSAKVPGG